MSSNKTSSARDERNPSSRVDMPFASVASAAIVPESGKSATKTTVQPQPGLTPLQTTSLKNIKSEESPPATPESANSVDSPLTRSRKEDGRKSPAESSEVDLDSLSGRGKAGSEDSRMDVECSSSSDIRTRPGRRRPASTKDVEKGEDKLNLSAKRKRKSRGDTNSRGRGVELEGVWQGMWKSQMIVRRITELLMNKNLKDLTMLPLLTWQNQNLILPPSTISTSC